MAEKFDFEAALKAVQSGQSITGKDGVLGPLVKQLTEAALEAELDSHHHNEIGDGKESGETPPANKRIKIICNVCCKHYWYNLSNALVAQLDRAIAS